VYADTHIEHWLHIQEHLQSSQVQFQPDNATVCFYQLCGPLPAQQPVNIQNKEMSGSGLVQIIEFGSCVQNQNKIETTAF
jgi:hypothetical protein